MKNCEFCNLTNEEKKWLIYSSTNWDIYLSDKQDYIGRSILVLKRHCENISGLSDDEWFELKNLITIYENTIARIFDVTNFNWTCLMNNAFKSENGSPHLHFHVRPRYENAIEILGKYYYDNEFSHHYNNHGKNLLDNNGKLELLKMIKPLLINQSPNVQRRSQ